jgi:hypothetical protein
MWVDGVVMILVVARLQSQVMVKKLLLIISMVR